MMAIEQAVCITLSWKVSLAQLPGFPHTETPGLEAERGRGSVGRNRRGKVRGWEQASLNHFSRQSGEQWPWWFSTWTRGYSGPQSECY